MYNLGFATIIGFHKNTTGWERHLYAQNWKPSLKDEKDNILQYPRYRKAYISSRSNVVIITGQEEYFKGMCVEQIYDITMNIKARLRQSGRLANP